MCVLVCLNGFLAQLMAFTDGREKVMAAADGGHDYLCSIVSLPVLTDFLVGHGWRFYS
jgi:hypothetical protein